MDRARFKYTVRMLDDQCPMLGYRVFLPRVSYKQTRSRLVEMFYWVRGISELGSMKLRVGNRQLAKNNN